MQRFESEHDNFRAALRWLLENDIISFAELASVLERFWYIQGYPVEGREWVERAIDRLEEIPRTLHASLYVAGGNLAFPQGDLVQAEALLKQALEISRQLDDKINVAWSLIYLANIYDESIALVEEGITLFEQLNHTKGLAQAYNILGEIARSAGEYRRAQEAYEMCLDLSRQTGEEVRIAMLLNNLSFVAYHDQDYAHAEQLARKCLMTCLEIENMSLTAHNILSTANVLAINGDPKRSMRILSACDAWFEERGLVYLPTDKQEADRLIADLRTRLGAEEFEDTWREGQQLSLEQAIELALQYS